MRFRVERVPVERLRHIEGWSEKRLRWLTEKIRREGVWTRPLCLEREHDLVMDGQHRLEAARALGLLLVPAIRFGYDEVEVWSLRPTHQVTPELVVSRTLAGNPYPYKTVKHRFPPGLEGCAVPLDELRTRGGSAQ